MKETPISFYRTTDSVDNFKLRVSIREIGRLVSEAGAKASEAFNEDVVLSWQEKLYGPRELAEFLKNKDHKPKDKAEQDVRRQLHHMEENSKSVGDMLKPVMLYTYTDKDPHMPLEKLPVKYTTDENVEPYLASAVGVGSGAAAGPRERKVRDRLLREKPSKVMHVCLATDVEVEALRSRDFWDPAAHYKEHLLCTVKMFSDGLVEMSPALSPAVEEGHGSHGMQIASACLFMSEETVAAAIKKGMKVATSRVRSRKGTDFEYCLSNPNDLFHPQQIDDKRKSTLAADAIRARTSRGNGEDDVSSFSAWRQDPPSAGYDKSISFFGEIVSGLGFSADKIFVDYEVVVPDGWNMRTGNLSDGIGEEDLLQKSKGVGLLGSTGTSVLGRQTAENTDAATLQKDASAARLMVELDGYADGEEAEGMLHGVTQVASPKEQRGGLTLPVLRPQWQGQRLTFTLSSEARACIAAAFMVFECLSLVFFNLQYPFWLVSALVVVFTVGSGYEGGHQQALINETGIGKGSGLSKIQRNRTLQGGLVAEYAAHFNHLINLSFDCKDESRMGFAGIDGKDNGQGPIMTPSAYTPTVIFSVYSIGAFGRINLEGYSYVHLPSSSGTIDTTIKCWRPLGGINAEMRSFFLGASPYLNDKNGMYATGQGGKKTSISSLNMFGVSSENAGEIRFRCNVSVTDPRRAKMVLGKQELSTQNTKTVAITRTVDEILKNYRSGVALDKSVELSTGTGGFSGIANLSSKAVGSSIDSNLLSKKAELLIAQAKARVSSKGGGDRVSSSMPALGGDSKLGSLVSSGMLSSVRESKDSDAKGGEDEDAPLLATMTRQQGNGRYGDLDDTEDL